MMLLCADGSLRQSSVPRLGFGLAGTFGLSAAMPHERTVDRHPDAGRRQAADIDRRTANDSSRGPADDTGAAQRRQRPADPCFRRPYQALLEQLVKISAKQEP